MSAYFITSSGTGIGKTFTTCALIYAARKRGIAIAPYKPVISGFDASAPEGSDTCEILNALNAPRNEALHEISPWRFEAPLSPNMAAAREGKEIDFAKLVTWSRALLNGSGLTLIEGVGGVMVPLNNTHTVRDWMAALKIPVILVTGSYLGSISHTLTAVESLRMANIPIKALIVSESEGSTVPLDETLTTLGTFTRDIPLQIAQPRVSSYEKATQTHALLDQLI